MDPIDRRDTLPPSVRPQRHWLRWAGLLLAVLALARCSVNMLGAETRVQDLCAQITPRMTLHEVERFAAENGLGLGRLREGSNPLPEKKSMGRHGCMVQLAAGRVLSSAYFHLD